MKEFDFEQLKNIDIEFPESWVENVLNSPEEKRKYAVPNRFFYAAASAAACVVIAAAVTLSLLFGIGGNVDLIDPNPISNPSQADDISGGTVPSTLSDSGLPSGIPPLMIGGDNQSSTSSTEPSENSGKSESGKSKAKQNASNQPANDKKKQSADSKPQGKSGQKPAVSGTTQPQKGEPVTEQRVTQEQPIEPLPEDDGLEVDYCTIYAALDNSYRDSTVYCRIEKTDGTVIGNMGLFDSRRLASQTPEMQSEVSLREFVSFDYDPVGQGLVFYYDKPYVVIFYNSKGEVIKKKTIIFDYDEFDYTV